MRLAYLALVVRDYDEAIAYLTQKLGFVLVEDRDLGGGKRWVRVAPPDGGTGLLLAKAVTDKQRDAIGSAGGGRVAFFPRSRRFRRGLPPLAGKWRRFCRTAPPRALWQCRGLFRPIR